MTNEGRGRRIGQGRADGKSKRGYDLPNYVFYLPSQRSSVQKSISALWTLKNLEQGLWLPCPTRRGRESSRHCTHSHLGNLFPQIICSTEMGHNYKFLVHNQFHYVSVRKMMSNSCVFSKFMERMDKSNSALGKSCSVLKIIVASSKMTFLYSPKVFDGSP